MPRLPPLARLPRLPDVPTGCLPISLSHKDHNENSDHNPLSLQDTVQDSTTSDTGFLKRSGSASSQGPTNNFFARWPDGVRGHVIAMIAELVGTTSFLFFGFAAAQTANEKDDTLSGNGEGGPSLLQIAYIATAFGMSLAVNVWIFYRVSGGMFNPAVRHPSNPKQSR